MNLSLRYTNFRHFIDFSNCKISLKTVLLQNGNEYAAVPLAHSTTLKESHENINLLLDKIKYYEHWKKKELAT